jgi:hypothetical protein
VPAKQRQLASETKTKPAQNRPSVAAGLQTAFLYRCLAGNGLLKSDKCREKGTTCGSTLMIGENVDCVTSANVDQNNVAWFFRDQSERPR